MSYTRFTKKPNFAVCHLQISILPPGNQYDKSEVHTVATRANVMTSMGASCKPPPCSEWGLGNIFPMNTTKSLLEVSHCKSIFFKKKYYNNHDIACPWGWSMKCPLQVDILISVSWIRKNIHMTSYFWDLRSFLMLTSPLFQIKHLLSTVLLSGLQSSLKSTE